MYFVGYVNLASGVCFTSFSFIVLSSECRVPFLSRTPISSGEGHREAEELSAGREIPVAAGGLKESSGGNEELTSLTSDSIPEQGLSSLEMTVTVGCSLLDFEDCTASTL